MIEDIIFVPERKTKVTTNIAKLVNERYGGSVAAMAEALGVDRTTLWRLATGVTRDPTWGLLVQIAKHHDLPLDQFVK